MTQVNVQEASGKLDALVDAALSGEEVIVGREGQPLVRLVPVETASPPRRMFGSARGKIWMAPDFDDPLPEFEEYMR